MNWFYLFTDKGFWSGAGQGTAARHRKNLQLFWGTEGKTLPKCKEQKDMGQHHSVIRLFVPNKNSPLHLDPKRSGDLLI